MSVHRARVTLGSVLQRNLQRYQKALVEQGRSTFAKGLLVWQKLKTCSLKLSLSDTRWNYSAEERGQAVKSPFERRAQKSNDKGQTEN